MSEIQLFYLTIMIALLILYLVVCKICDVKETKYKAIAMSSMEAKNTDENYLKANPRIEKKKRNVKKEESSLNNPTEEEKEVDTSLEEEEESVDGNE